MSEHDALADLLMKADMERDEWSKSTYEAQADTLRAAGWRKMPPNMVKLQPASVVINGVRRELAQPTECGGGHHQFSTGATVCMCGELHTGVRENGRRFWW